MCPNGKEEDQVAVTLCLNVRLIALFRKQSLILWLNVAIVEKASPFSTIPNDRCERLSWQDA